MLIYKWFDFISFSSASTSIFIGILLLSGCTSTSRSDFDSECDYAKKQHEEMQDSVRYYYAIGRTGLIEFAVAERRLRKAKEDYKSACGEEAPDEGLLDKKMKDAE